MALTFQRKVLRMQELPENRFVFSPSLRSSRDLDVGRPHDSGAASSECFESLLGEAASGRVVATRRSFRKGEVVFHEGDVADGCHVVSSGRFAVRCEVTTGSPVTLAILGRPDVFGEFGLFAPDHRRTATVLAMT